MTPDAPMPTLALPLHVRAGSCIRSDGAFYIMDSTGSVVARLDSDSSIRDEAVAQALVTAANAHDSQPPDCDVAQVVEELRRLRDEATEDARRDARLGGIASRSFHNGSAAAYAHALRLLSGSEKPLPTAELPARAGQSAQNTTG